MIFIDTIKLNCNNYGNVFKGLLELIVTFSNYCHHLAFVVLLYETFSHFCLSVFCCKTLQSNGTILCAILMEYIYK